MTTIEEKLEQVGLAISKDPITEQIYHETFNMPWTKFDPVKLRSRLNRFVRFRVRKKFRDPEFLDCDIVDELNMSKPSTPLTGAICVTFRGFKLTLWLDHTTIEIYTRVKYGQRLDKQ